MFERQLKIVLVAPEIPGNTGTIGRTCVALNMELVLIRPYGFDITDKAVRRAGLDYWRHVQLSEFDTWDNFIAERAPARETLFLFEEFGETSVYEARFPPSAYLVFGSETKGLSAKLVTDYRDRTVSLPMGSPHIRSLNLSNAVCAAAYQAMRP